MYQMPKDLRRLVKSLAKAAINRHDATLVVGDETRADGVPDELGHVVGVELPHDVGAVALDGLSAQIEEVGDPLVGVAARDQPEDLPLAQRERLVVVRGASSAGGWSPRTRRT